MAPQREDILFPLIQAQSQLIHATEMIRDRSLKIYLFLINTPAE